MNRTILLFFILILGVQLDAQIIAVPDISRDSDFYEGSFQVEITHEDTSVILLYTLDGSEPRIENLAGKTWNYKIDYPRNLGQTTGVLFKDTLFTYEYSSPILIENLTNKTSVNSRITTSIYGNEENYIPTTPVFRGVVLKAVAYDNGTYSEVVTRTYFVTPEGRSKYSMPVFSLSMDSDKMYGYENGLNVPGKDFDDWRANNPDVYFSGFSPANYHRKGKETEFKAHLSFFDAGKEKLNHHFGLRMNGNFTRIFPNKSFRMYAKSDYGEKNFKYPFFENSTTDKFKRLLLRNGGNDAHTTIFRDALVHDLTRNLNYSIQESTPVVVFINGEYNGIRNLRERFDDKYFNSKFEIHEDSLDFYDFMGELDTGQEDYYNEMVAFFEGNSLEDDAIFEEAMRFLDPINYTDYLITNIYIANTDWPHNNYNFFRNRVTFNPNAEIKEKDGRFRWILKDTDHGLNIDLTDQKYKFDAMDWATRFSEGTYPGDIANNLSTLLIRKMLENDNYKTYFINRFADVMNTTLRKDRVLSYVATYRLKYKNEIDENSKRWPNFARKMNDWEEAIAVMETFIQKREAYQQQHIINKFELDGTYELIVNVSDETQGYVHLNSIDLLPSTDGIAEHPYIWEGTYYKGIPITLTPMAKEGYQFSHWSGNVSSTDSVLTLTLDEDTYVKANFIASSEVSTKDISKASKEVLLYPNPFTNTLHLLLDAYEGNYKIYSIEGKIVASGSITTSELDVSSLTSGTFLLEIETKGAVLRKSIVKQ